MFFIPILAAFFLQTVRVMSLQCMTDASILLQQCAFTTPIAGSIPSDQDLLTQHTYCQMKEANAMLTLSGRNDGSCYAEVTINYKAKTMNVRLTHINGMWYTISPYDDMVGNNKKIKSVIQYKINGNLEKNEVELSARFQCKTGDNCALAKLRTFLPDLIKPEARLPVFQQVIALLNTPDANQGSEPK
jgi:hypothetical protein